MPRNPFSRSRSKAGRTASLPTTRDAPLVGFAYAPLQREQIRVLSIDSATDPDADISCYFHTLPLSTKTNYVAISYRWSQGAHQHSINLDDRAFVVRSGLCRLLKSLRQFEASTLFWIDALCIDQENRGEKSYQVSVMDRVFHQATSVIVWIDPEYDSLGNHYTITLTGFGHLKAWEDKDCAAYSIPNGSSQVEGMLAVLNHEYWTRRWIVQEIAHARFLYIRCGSTRLKMATLREFLKVSGIVEFYDTLAAQMLWSTESLRNNPVALSRLLELFQATKCKDPLDKIFALLSLSDVKDSIEVDYSTDALTLVAKILHVICEKQTSKIPHVGGRRLVVGNELIQFGALLVAELGCLAPPETSKYQYESDLIPFDLYIVGQAIDQSHNPNFDPDLAELQRLMPELPPLYNYRHFNLGKDNRLATDQWDSHSFISQSSLRFAFKWYDQHGVLRGGFSGKEVNISDRIVFLPGTAFALIYHSDEHRGLSTRTKPATVIFSRAVLVQPDVKTFGRLARAEDTRSCTLEMIMDRPTHEDEISHWTFWAQFDTILRLVILCSHASIRPQQINTPREQQNNTHRKQQNNTQRKQQILPETSGISQHTTRTTDRTAPAALHFTPEFSDLLYIVLECGVLWVSLGFSENPKLFRWGLVIGCMVLSGVAWIIWPLKPIVSLLLTQLLVLAPMELLGLNGYT